MPLILAGIGWIGRLLVAFLPWVVAQIATIATRKVAVVAAMVAAYVALTAAFYVSLYGVMHAVIVVAPPGFGQACGMFLPSNTYLCLAAVISTYVTRWIYDAQVRLLTFANPGSGL